LKGLRKISLALALTVLCASTAAASEAAGGGHHYNWGDLAFRIINFIIFIAIIWKFAGKKIVDFFRSRRYDIENELGDLSKRKAEAQTRLKDVEQSIKDLEQERQKILTDYKKQGETLKASIIEKAEKQAEQIREQAKLTAQQEAKTAVSQIRAEVAEMVTDAAEKMLGEKLTKEEHEKLIDKSLTKVVLN
jgi:F-type H+-transporting ATPase subunit b